ncbi:hypothetical protein AZE99_06145 [Sphingorhabdus sp. M41]|nr:hypothetical protein AZE99_06145 [Sphingorhabdus sp. M41]
MGAVMNPMGENVQKYAELFLLVRSTGRGTIRRMVEGLCAILTSFGPSVAHSARHLPKASLQGGCA